MQSSMKAIIPTRSHNVWTSIFAFFKSLWKGWTSIPASTRWLILACFLCLALGAGIARGYYKPRLDAAHADADYYKQRNAVYDGYARSELRHLIDDNRSIGSQLEQYRLDHAAAVAAVERAVARSANSLTLIAQYGSIGQQNTELYKQARQLIADIRAAVGTLAGESQTGGAAH
jgi:hypothetical protein